MNVEIGTGHNCGSCKTGQNEDKLPIQDPFLGSIKFSLATAVVRGASLHLSNWCPTWSDHGSKEVEVAWLGRSHCNYCNYTDDLVVSLVGQMGLSSHPGFHPLPSENDQMAIFFETHAFCLKSGASSGNIHKENGKLSITPSRREQKLELKRKENKNKETFPDLKFLCATPVTLSR